MRAAHIIGRPAFAQTQPHHAAQQRQPCKAKENAPASRRALLDQRSRLLSNPSPSADQLAWALGFQGENGNRRGLQAQIRWAIKQMLLAKHDYPQYAALTYADGSSAPPPPGLSPGEYVIARALAPTSSPGQLAGLLPGFQPTYAKLFGDPTRPNVSIPTDGGLLPQVGLVWSADRDWQFFGNFSQNVNAYPYSPQSGVYNTNATAFDFFKDNTKPEKATTIEGGVRMRKERVEASLGLYTIDYNNRLIGVAVCPLTATCVSSFANVGGVSTRGAEALLSFRLADGLSWVNSAAFNDSKIDNDYKSGTTTVASSGKTVVDAPKVLANSSLRLTRGGVLGSLSARHVGKRYFSILNDIAAPSYTTLDMSAGYTFKRVGALKGLSIQMSAMNLLDEKYIATVGTGGFSVSGDLETLMAGSKRLVFLTVGTSF